MRDKKISWSKNRGKECQTEVTPPRHPTQHSPQSEAQLSQLLVHG